MNQKQEHTTNSFSIPFRSHTALLLSAALPYLQPSYRHPVELALKFLEFSETMKLYREFHPTEGSFFRSQNHPSPEDGKDSGFFGLLNTVVTDLEGLLNSLATVCTGGEREIIGMFLNMIRVKNFYETYGDLMNMQLFSSPEPSPEPSPDFCSEASSPFPSDLSSMLSDDQKETLNLLKNLFSAD